MFGYFAQARTTRGRIARVLAGSRDAALHALALALAPGEVVLSHSIETGRV